MEAPPQPKRRGPAPRLSAPAVAEAVLTLGFDQATLMSVAKHLGVAHGALYRYIGDRNGMMRDAMTLAVGRFDWPELVDGWQDVVWNEARAWWTFCETHPGFVTVLASVPGSPAVIARRSIAVAVHLHDLGVGGQDALVAVDFLSGTIHNIFAKQAQRTAVLDEVHTMSPDELDEVVNTIPPDMLEVMAMGLVDDPWPWFSVKLQHMIDGIESHLST